MRVVANAGKGGVAVFTSGRWCSVESFYVVELVRGEPLRRLSITECPALVGLFHLSANYLLAL